MRDALANMVKIITGLILLVTSVGSAVGQSFTVTTVDSTPKSGYGASLAIDPVSGEPRIVYQWTNASNFFFSEARYASLTAGTWSWETVYTGSVVTDDLSLAFATDGSNNPTISFVMGSTVLRYGEREGGSWTTESVLATAGLPVALAWRETADAATPMIFYRDAGATDLEFTSYNNATMMWFSPTTVDNNGINGESLDVAISSNGTNWGIVYLGGGLLRYAASFNGGLNIGSAFVSANVMASRCAIAMDASGFAHIVVHDTTTNNLRYLSNASGFPPNTGSPGFEIIANVGPLGTHPGLSVAVGSDGVVRVAFTNYTTGKLNYAVRSGANQWSVQTVDESGSNGGYCSLKLDSQNRPHIAYFNETSETLKYASFASPVTPGSGAPEFAVSGKRKRETSSGKIVIKGTASGSTAFIEWRIGSKGPFKRVSAGANWTLRVKPLKAGKNKVQIRAAAANGTTSSIKTIRIERN